MVEMGQRGRLGQIVVCHGKTFIVYSKSNGKPVENFKQGSDI